MIFQSKATEFCVSLPRKTSLYFSSQVLVDETVWDAAVHRLPRFVREFQHFHNFPLLQHYRSRRLQPQIPTRTSRPLWDVFCAPQPVHGFLLVAALGTCSL